MKLYPMAVNLNGRKCLVVGGGKVAERKIHSLLDTGAEITVISLKSTVKINEWHDQKRITLVERAFQSHDLNGMDIVIAATNSTSVNIQVYESSHSHQWINIVDRPDLCNFFVPAVIQRGDLQISISTAGQHPGFAKKLKKNLEDWIGPEYEEYIRFLGEMRKKILGKQLPKDIQKELIHMLLDDQFLEWTRQGKWELRNHEAIKLIDSLCSIDMDSFHSP